MEEVYKTITGFENYEVSNFGNVRNISTKRILKTENDKDLYGLVRLFILGKKHTKKIHRLVAEAFIDNPDNKPSVDHRDNNRLNNNVLNLRYATHMENAHNVKIRKDNTSGTKGVSFYNSRNKWVAEITIDGIKVYLGSFENKEDAIQARIIKANQVFGIFTNACEQINEI